MEPLLHHGLRTLVLILPLFICIRNLVLHILQSLRQHLGEVLAELINTRLKVVDDLALGVHVLLDVSLQLVTLFGKPLNLQRVVRLAVLEAVDPVGKVLLHRFELPSHVGNDVHLNFLLLGDSPLKLQLSEPLFVFDCLFTISVLSLRQKLGGQSFALCLQHLVGLFLAEAELATALLLGSSSFSFLLSTHFKN